MSAPGFAVAAGSPSGGVIHTDDAGLRTAHLSTASGAPVYAAWPLSPMSSPPVVLVAAEIFGLHEHILDVVRRFAQLGYLAVAPDYLAAYGDPLTAPDIEAIRGIVARAPDSVTMRLFDDALDLAAELGGDPMRAAFVGFCWGGRLAWLYAAHNPRLRACAPWYGRLDGPRTALQPRWPIDIAGSLRVPTLGLYGGDDPSIPPDLVEAMRRSLTAARAPAEIVVYADAPHGFYADYRESYRPAVAAAAWSRMLAFLKAQGV